MNRRALIMLLGGAAAWPFAALAQQTQRVRRIGVFMPGVADDPEFQGLNAAFLQRLAELGWIVGRNVRIDYRWGAGEAQRYPSMAAELIGSAPDIVLAVGSLIVSALQTASSSVPIVFANVTDPVGGGLVASLARPGGNTTGFITSEFGFAGKWLELLKDVAPWVTRAAVMRDSAVGAQVALFGSIQSVAPSIAAIITSLVVPAFAAEDPAKAEQYRVEEQKKKETQEIERAYRDAVKRTSREQPGQKPERYDPWRTAR